MTHSTIEAFEAAALQLAASQHSELKATGFLFWQDYPAVPYGPLAPEPMLVMHVITTGPALPDMLDEELGQHVCRVQQLRAPVPSDCISGQVDVLSLGLVPAEAIPHAAYPYDPSHTGEAASALAMMLDDIRQLEYGEILAARFAHTSAKMKGGPAGARVGPEGISPFVASVFGSNDNKSEGDEAWTSSVMAVLPKRRLTLLGQVPDYQWHYDRVMPRARGHAVPVNAPKAP